MDHGVYMTYTDSISVVILTGHSVLWTPATDDGAGADVRTASADSADVLSTVSCDFTSLLDGNTHH